MYTLSFEKFVCENPVCDENDDDDDDKNELLSLSFCLSSMVFI